MSEEEKEELLKASDFLYELDKSGYKYSCYGREIYIRDNVFRVIEKLQKENKELKEENKKINKAADKMYEYISYYGWEDFESNTGCNREEMVDYFYKE